MYDRNVAVFTKDQINQFKSAYIAELKQAYIDRVSEVHRERIKRDPKYLDYLKAQFKIKGVCLETLARKITKSTGQYVSVYRLKGALSGRLKLLAGPKFESVLIDYRNKRDYYGKRI